MRVLICHGLDVSRVQAAFKKFVAAMQRDDWRSASVKKLHPSPYYRAKLDRSNRLLLQFVRQGEALVCLVLEVILNHDYAGSRFLRGVAQDPDAIWLDPSDEAPDPDADTCRQEATLLPYLHPQRAEFHLLDKVLSFDDVQQRLFEAAVPLILIGAAGSGKTALTLERLRLARGAVLYVTQSDYLAQNARRLYSAHGYDNPAQEPEFMSYADFVQSLHVPSGREVRFAAFSDWVQRHRASLRLALGDSAAHADAHALFEEFRGVITASPQGPLSRSDYLALGVRQSLLGSAQREAAYDLYDKYRAWLADTGQYDPNLVAHAWQAHAEPLYDFVVVDEVQDLTPVQLALILKTLRKPGQFVLCGDSNQIVHPNFFSWSGLRALFWRDPALVGEAAARQGDGAVGAAGVVDGVGVLQANFRNAAQVTRLANRLLKIKHARFGSVDRESNFLVQPGGQGQGQVQLLADKDATRRELNLKTRQSAQFAIIVLRDEDKAQARADFQTPLVFSVHEAKGLEYPHIILLGLISGQRQAYAEICAGVQPQDVAGDELQFRRARDKGDKSLEIYKFYVNALYVALTRAVDSVYLLESDTRHPLLALLELDAQAGVQGLQAQTSSRDDWALEARKLEQQGKQEQAQAIREQFLKLPTPPWPVWDAAWLDDTQAKALDSSRVQAKSRQQLLEYALWHDQSEWANSLALLVGFVPARQLEFVDYHPDPAIFDPNGDPVVQQEAYARTRMAQTTQAQRQRHLQPYTSKNSKDVLRQCDQYGIDHRHLLNTTALMLAVQAGNLALIDTLLERGADPSVRDHYGHTAWDHALVRYLRDAHYARHTLPAVAERLLPQAIDVQTGGRLIRIERHQGEFWPLMLMLAGYKSLCSELHQPHADFYRYRKGFFADSLLQHVEHLPPHLWKPERRKRSAMNAVLARAEVASDYRPSRQLWRRISTGHYLPNPQMQLKVQVTPSDDHPQGWTWQPVYEVLNLRQVEPGTRAAYLRDSAAGEVGGWGFGHLLFRAEVDPA